MNIQITCIADFIGAKAQTHIIMLLPNGCFAAETFMSQRPLPSDSLQCWRCCKHVTIRNIVCYKNVRLQYFRLMALGIFWPTTFVLNISNEFGVSLVDNTKQIIIGVDPGRAINDVVKS